MIKTVVSTMAIAMVAANEDASMLLQFHPSQGRRIPAPAPVAPAAVAEQGTGKDTLDDILIDDDTRDGKKGKKGKDASMLLQCRPSQGNCPPRAVAEQGTGEPAPAARRRRRRRQRQRTLSARQRANRVPWTAPQCEFFGVGTPALGTEEFVSPSDKKTYHQYLKGLDVRKLYDTIVRVMKTSQNCWPADGPQDNDVQSYAGLFGRLAWHCSGTLRIINDKATGGCEGGRLRHWPEKEWRDNVNLDQARAILAEVKNMPEYQELSWGDLITFAGTVGIKASGGPAHKFCFGRIDDSDGRKSIMLGTDGITQCELGADCVSNSPCEKSFQWPEQDPGDHSLCNVTQADGRFQGSHGVGLIYVYPEGPQLRQDNAEFDPTQKHQRSARLSALEVRDTFKNRMGWTDQETVALIGGGHTLGRTHGNCANKNKRKKNTPCRGKFTSSSGFEGAWTRTPSKWNYDFFDALLDEEWVATQSPDGADQWWTKDRKSSFAKTIRLTADLSLLTDPVYKKWAIKYSKSHELFDKAFAKAWFKLTHRSQDHPLDDDLAKDAKKCTSFDWIK